jgi:hypothetical protein
VAPRVGGAPVNANAFDGQNQTKLAGDTTVTKVEAQELACGRVPRQVMPVQAERPEARVLGNTATSDAGASAVMPHFLNVALPTLDSAEFNEGFSAPLVVWSLTVLPGAPRPVVVAGRRAACSGEHAPDARGPQATRARRGTSRMVLLCFIHSCGSHPLGIRFVQNVCKKQFGNLHHAGRRQGVVGQPDLGAAVD